MSLKNLIKTSSFFPLLIRAIFPSKIKIKGQNLIQRGKSIIKNCSVEIIGQNNTIILDDIIIENSTIRIYGNQNIIKIGKDSFIRNAIFHIEDNNGIILLGSKVCISGKTILSVIEGTKINIGDDCLFSTNVMLSSGDSHSVIDIDSGKRINPSRDISIGNHVWFGHDTTVLKGVKIFNNTIIGACAVVTKSVDSPNVVVAGNPAKILKCNVDWKYDRE